MAHARSTSSLKVTESSRGAGIFVGAALSCVDSGTLRRIPREQTLNTSYAQTTMNHETHKEQFLETYDSYADAIFRFCLMKVSRKEVAEDITQDTFMRFWQSVREGKDVDNVRAFLYTIARNLVIDWYRKKKEASLDEMAEAGLEFVGDGRDSVELPARFKEVMRAVESLEEDSREVVVLCYLEGLSPKDVAVMTGTTANVVSVRLNRALKKIRTIVEPT